MKIVFYKQLMALVMLLAVQASYAQLPELQYYRPNNKGGLNVFETPKENDVTFEGLKLRVGGDFSMQFQGISQSNDPDFDSLSLIDLANNFNLPSANLNLDLQLADGVRMHLRTFLSSRHHNESWVKGGHIQIDKLDFIREGFLSGFMEMATFRFGMDEFNYGDTHFRRSDNARAIYNPFVGNYLMDSYTTEPFAELTVQNNGILAVAGLSNGRLNQTPKPGDDGFAVFAKLGYDNQLSDDLRVRLTGSFYSSSDKSTRDYLYSGDRAGARYYYVMHSAHVTGDSQPRFNSGYAYQTAVQINPFVKFKGLEVFGVLEFVSNGDGDAGGGYNQIGAEALYRIGSNEELYIGGRYNQVSGKAFDGAADMTISRLNFGGGWFMTDNIVTKVEYVNQNYTGDAWDATIYEGAEFKGVVIEAAISF